MRSPLFWWWVVIIKRSLEIKLPPIWRDKSREEKSREKEKVRRKEIQAREMVVKLRNTAFSKMICGPGGSKSRRAKAGGAEPSGQMGNENLHADAPRKTFHFENMTGSDQDVQKWHAAVATSTFPNQNVQNKPAPDHFWQLGCREMARRCGQNEISQGHFWKFRCRTTAYGAKQITQVKMLKTWKFGPLLEG